IQPEPHLVVGRHLEPFGLHRGARVGSESGNGGGQASPSPPPCFNPGPCARPHPNPPPQAGGGRGEASTYQTEIGSVEPSIQVLRSCAYGSGIPYSIH